MKHYLRVVLKQTPSLWYDYELPEGAQLPQIVAQMQMAGFFLAPKFWIPYDSIAHMCIIDVNNGETIDFTKARGMN